MRRLLPGRKNTPSESARLHPDAWGDWTVDVHVPGSERSLNGALLVP